jgi:hypothetical protein
MNTKQQSRLDHRNRMAIYTLTLYSLLLDGLQLSDLSGGFGNQWLSDLAARVDADLQNPVFVSPHDDYPHDHGWKLEGALEALMHKVGLFDRKDVFDMQGH